MNLQFYITRLRANTGVFEHLLNGISEEESKWKPSHDKWSILEVVNHLCDEEISDFRARLESVIQNPEKNWTPINSQGWVVEREYNKRELAESFERFKKERLKNLDWLVHLENVNWNNFYNHASGEIKAGDLLVSWTAHDLIHIRQITALQWEILNSVSQPYSASYAGKW